MGKTRPTTNLIYDLRLMPQFSKKVHEAANKRELEKCLQLIGENYGEIPDTLLICLHRRAIFLGYEMKQNETGYFFKLLTF